MHHTKHTLKCDETNKTCTRNVVAYGFLMAQVTVVICTWKWSCNIQYITVYWHLPRNYAKGLCNNCIPEGEFLFMVRHLHVLHFFIFSGFKKEYELKNQSFHHYYHPLMQITNKFSQVCLCFVCSGYNFWTTTDRNFIFSVQIKNCHI